MSAAPNLWIGFADPTEATGRIAALGHYLAAAQSGAGVQIGTTPKEEIWRDGKVTLARYRRPEETAASLPPLLIVHGLIGRHTVSDLEPGRSLVERLLAMGGDLFVIDWGNPGPEDRYKDFTDYAEEHLSDALSVIRDVTGQAKTALLGICQGGVFVLCHAARHPEDVLGVVLTITPVDFHADLDPESGPDGLLNHWIRNLPAELIDDLIDAGGVLSGQLTGALFQQLAPARTLAKYTSGLASMVGDKAALDRFLRMEKWLADRPDMPGAAGRQWLIDLYQQNQLVAGRFQVAGSPVDLGKITCPVLNVFGAQDHIVPPACSRALGPILAGKDYQAIEIPTGHAGVFVSHKAQSVTAPAIAGWLGALS